MRYSFQFSIRLHEHFSLYRILHVYRQRKQDFLEVAHVYVTDILRLLRMYYSREGGK